MPPAVAAEVADDPLERFARCLPYRVRCSGDLAAGLAWASRDVALLQREIAPDPEGWRTSLRFDCDCPCDGQPHKEFGYCPRAATFWRDAGLPEPSFVVVNPANGHAHCVYLLRGWLRVDGSDAKQLNAVRYYASVERAYTRALRADPAYAGLVHHSPFSPRYTALPGRAEPYSLGELASYVKLTATPRRREPEIRTDGRNVEVFDRLRFWAYRAIGEWRCGTFAPWAALVAEKALALAAEARQSHCRASHPFSDREALGVAKSVAGWVWLRYDGANALLAVAREAARRTYDRGRAMLRRRADGSIPRDAYLSEVHERRVAARKLRDMGLAVEEVARRLSASVRSVHRWIAELRSVPSPSRLSDFAPRSQPGKRTTTVSGLEPAASSSSALPSGERAVIVPQHCDGVRPNRAERGTKKAHNETLEEAGSVDLLAYARDKLAVPKVPLPAPVVDAPIRYETALDRIQQRIREIRSN